jgi:hypothetical protein
MIIHVGIGSPVSELLEYQNDLKEFNIILVINDVASNQEMAQLLKLYPRYMTFDTADDTILALLEQRVKE